MLNMQVNEPSISEEDKLLTVKEAAEYIKESPGVVRNWLRELKALIPVVIGENGYRYFNNDSLHTLTQVKEMRNIKQMSLKQIEDELTSPIIPFNPINADATEKILHDLTTIKEELELQKNFNQVLVQQLKKQQDHIEIQNQQIIQQKKHIVTLENRSTQANLEVELEQSARKSVDNSKQKKNHFFRVFSYR